MKHCALMNAAAIFIHSYNMWCYLLSALEAQGDNDTKHKYGAKVSKINRRDRVTTD